MNSLKMGAEMKKNKFFWFILFFVGIACITACTSFAYKYYGIQFPESGKVDDVLLFVPKGSEAPKDIPFSTCKPDEQVAGKCIVSLQADYFSILKDNESCHVRLAELERRCGKP